MHYLLALSLWRELFGMNCFTKKTIIKEPIIFHLGWRSQTPILCILLCNSRLGDSMSCIIAHGLSIVLHVFPHSKKMHNIRQQMESRMYKGRRIHWRRLNL